MTGNKERSSSLAINKKFGIRKAERKKATRKPSKHEKKKTRNSFIFSVINSWIKPDSTPVSAGLLTDCFKCIKDLVKLMDHKFNEEMLLATVIYADKFVKKSSLIDSGELFQLLLVSALISLKFWEDLGVDVGVAAYVSGIPKAVISKLERTFLGTIDYALMLQPSDVQEFLPPSIQQA